MQTRERAQRAWWRRGWIQVVGLAALAGLLAVYSAYWWIATSMVRQFIYDAASDQQNQGTEVALGGFQVAGYPFAIDAAAGPVTIRWPDGVRWDGDHARAWATPWNPTFVRFDLETQRLTVPTMVPTTPALIVANGEGSVHFDLQGRWQTGTIRLDDLRLTVPTLAETAPNPSLVTVGAFHVDGQMETPDAVDGAAANDPPTSSVTIGIQISDIGLPFGLHPFGTTISVVAGTVSGVGGVPTGLDAARLAAWTAAGGRLEIVALTAEWGSLVIRGSGSWILDRDLQPAGSLMAEIEGADTLVNALAAAGLLPADQLPVVRGAVRAMTPQVSDGGPPVMKAPLYVRNAALWFGPFRVMSVPRITWPGAL